MVVVSNSVMSTVLELHRLLFGPAMAAFAKCPVCREDMHAVALARAEGECPLLCMGELHNPCVVLIPCGHTTCGECFAEFRARHRGEAIIDMRPLPPVPAQAAEEVGGAMSEAGSDDTALWEGEVEAALAAPTLPLPGGPRAKSEPRPPALRPTRPLHPAPPIPVMELDLPGWARPHVWNFGFTWRGELSAWVVDSRHGEVNLINPVTYGFVTTGSHTESPPTPPGTLAVWRHTQNPFNRRWTLVLQ